MFAFPMSSFSLFFTTVVLLLLLRIDYGVCDHYETLGVSKTATVKEIRVAYRRIAKANHPDKNANNEAAVELFNAATAAYEVLIDADQRQIYDDFGDQQFQSEWEFRRAANQGQASVKQRDFYSSSEDVSEKILDVEFSKLIARVVVTWNTFNSFAKTATKVVEFYAPWFVFIIVVFLFCCLLTITRAGARIVKRLSVNTKELQCCWKERLLLAQQIVRVPKQVDYVNILVSIIGSVAM
jgi:hypothetical protein